MDLVTAVRTLRESLGMSQQAFANKLGLSIRAIANYEKDRRPGGDALVKMGSLAADHGLGELRDVFRLALKENLGLANDYARLGRLLVSDDFFHDLDRMLLRLRSDRNTSSEKLMQISYITSVIKTIKIQESTLGFGSGAVTKAEGAEEKMETK